MEKFLGMKSSVSYLLCLTFVTILWRTGFAACPQNVLNPRTYFHPQSGFTFCYWVGLSYCDYQQCETLCNTEGGTLALIPDANANVQVHQLQMSLDDAPWIAAKASQPPTYTNYAYNYVDRPYLAIGTNGLWYEYSDPARMNCRICSTSPPSSVSQSTHPSPTTNNKDSFTFHHVKYIQTTCLTSEAFTTPSRIFCAKLCAIEDFCTHCLYHSTTKQCELLASDPSVTCPTDIYSNLELLEKR